MGGYHILCNLALDLPILALHVPAINLIPTVAAVVVTVAPPTGVQTLPIRTSVQTEGVVLDQRLLTHLNKYSLSQWSFSGQLFSSDTSVQSGKPSQSRSLFEGGSDQFRTGFYLQKNTKTLVLAGELSLRVTHLLAITTTRGESGLEILEKEN